MRGEVAGHNNAFAPSCAEFAEECRFQQMSITAERRPRLDKPEPKDDGPRVDPRKLQLLKKALSGSLSAKRKLARMFPDNPIIARAAQEDSKEAAE
jgi:hypothetical protein